MKKSKLKSITIIFVTIVLWGIIGYYSSSIYSIKLSLDANNKTDIKPVDKSYFNNIEYIGWSKEDAIADISSVGWRTECIEEYSVVDKIGYVIKNHYNNENKTVTLYISKGMIVGDNIKTTGAKISVDKTDIILNKGESVEITIFVGGTLPDRYKFRWGAYPDISCKWGGWITDNSAKIILTGNEVSVGYARFYICNADNDEYVGYVDSYITIN